VATRTRAGVPALPRRNDRARPIGGCRQAADRARRLGLPCPGSRDACRRLGVRFSSPPARSGQAAIEAIPDDAWVPIPYWLGEGIFTNTHGPPWQRGPCRAGTPDRRDGSCRHAGTGRRRSGSRSHGSLGNPDRGLTAAAPTPRCGLPVRCREDTDSPSEGPAGHARGHPIRPRRRHRSPSITTTDQIGPRSPGSQAINRWIRAKLTEQLVA
jgi:hypothetical protein